MNKVDREIVHAYRHLYRGLLHAVQFSSPVRYVARDQLRSAFRERGASWNPEGAKRTLWFLHAAARETGLEHKILKNLLRVRLQQVRERSSWKRVLHESKSKNLSKLQQETALSHYEMTVAMLNKSMGLCLR
ncbi:hypothetical protein RJ55_00620 [Drechmeria coniospora]|nr:hypothetical protein RJ55_00620 [Drechmeria coniospora]